MMVESLSIEEKILEFEPDRIGITSLCIDVPKVIELSDKIKKCNDKIITFVGGTQAFLGPESFFVPSIDYVFNYTTKDNLIKFLNNDKNIEGVYQRENGFKDSFPKGKNEYILPNRNSSLKYREHYSYFGYRPSAIMEYGLGCENRCNFCLRWRIEGYKEIQIDKDITIADLKAITEPTIMFIDNDFLSSREKLISFLDIVKELNLKKNYIVYGSVKGVIKNQDLLKEFASLGLRAILIGYETFKDEELDNYNKKVTSDENFRASNILNECDIDVWASFMAHPDWNKADFKSFRAYIKKIRPQITTINPLTPFPNLPLYEEYKDRLLFSVTDYEKWSFGQLIIKPSKISVRRYYYELMITYLYVNLFINGNTKMLKKFGFMNVIRIGLGAIKASKNYIKLMIKG